MQLFNSGPSDLRREHLLRYSIDDVCAEETPERRVRQDNSVTWLADKCHNAGRLLDHLCEQATLLRRTGVGSHYNTGYANEERNLNRKISRSS
ncbi:hypothetical protein QFZ54_003727 [Sphingomonas faeni]|nr:hypothetical protein [Sphingomonas faeni]